MSVIRRSSYYTKEAKPLETQELVVEDVQLSFGGVLALDRLSFEFKHSGILAIIGPNGAGKTALLNCVSGFYRPQHGGIYFGGRDLTKQPPHRIAEMGLSRTFQNIELYPGISTVNNLMAGRHVVMKHSILSQFLYFGRAHREEIKHRQVVEEIIDFLDIEPIRYKIVAEIPYGLRKRVELGRALALNPTMLLLDEPMAGMNVDEKEDMARFILDINELKGIPVILIEHDMGLVMDIADWIIVLDFGKKIAEGTPQEIKVNPKVIQAYLGVEET